MRGAGWASSSRCLRRSFCWFFGADADHLLTGNGFTVVGALACGLGALLALDRDDRRGDAIACGLLCLGVVTYTTALAFVVGVGVSILIRKDRWKRIWIFAIPVAVYVAWWVWSLGANTSSEGQIALVDVLLFPSWAFQSLSAALSALTGFDYPYGDSANQIGPTLALLAIVGLGWRFTRAPAPAMLWGALATPLALWMMGAISRSLVRTPDSSRYLYPAAVVVLVLAASAVAGYRWRRPALIALIGLATVGLATNVALVKRSGAIFRGQGMLVRGDLAGIQIAGSNANPGYMPVDVTYPVDASFGPEHATGAYLAAADRYGDIGYSPDQLRAAAEPFKANADRTLVGALGLDLRPPTAVRIGGADCVTVGDGLGQIPSAQLAPGQTVQLRSAGPAAIRVRRFATDSGVAVGTLKPGRPQDLSVPSDQLPDPWRVTSDAPIRACITG